jgi:hypothetical protein
MANFNFTDFYILYEGHHRYNPNEIIEDEVIEVIIQKYEMILFTSKGELLGDPEFGADLYKYLHETRVSSDFIKSEIISQIESYITEIAGINYVLDVRFVADPERYQDMMFIDFKIKDYEVYSYFG